MAEHHPDCAKIRRVKPLYCTCGADRRIDQPPASTPAAVPDAVPDGRSVNWRQNATQRGVDAYKQWKGAPYGMSVEHLIHNVIAATLDEAGFFALRDERDALRGEVERLTRAGTMLEPVVEAIDSLIDSVMAGCEPVDQRRALLDYFERAASLRDHYRQQRDGIALRLDYAESALAAERERAEANARDAGRYRALRESPLYEPYGTPRIALPTSRMKGDFINGEDADAAIDAALAAAGREGR
jgi:hypothetical protein